MAIINQNQLSRILTGLILVGFLFWGASGCNSKQKAAEKAAKPTDVPTVLVADAVQKTVPIYSEYVAVIDPTTGSSTIEIRARVPAFLIKQCFEEGKRVKKGQLLFLLDPRTYKAAFQSAQAAKAKAQADLDYAKESVAVKRAKADVISAKAQLSLAKLNEARLKPLAEQKAVPQQDYDNAKTNLEVAYADLTAKEAMYRNTVLDQVNSIKLAQAEVLAAEADIQTAAVNLGYCTITSPIDGIAGKRNVAPGNLVGQGEPTLLTTVTDLNHLRVNFNASENDYLYLMQKKVSLKVELPTLELILSNGTVYPYKGKITIAQPVLDPKTGTIQLVGEFPNPGWQILRPGMFGRIRLAVDHRTNAILIPQKAVSELQSANIAYVVGLDNKIELRTLELDDVVGSNIIVRSGIKPGEKVVVEGLLKVQAGMTVKPVYQAASSEPTGQEAKPTQVYAKPSASPDVKQPATGAGQSRSGGK